MTSPVKKCVQDLSNRIGDMSKDDRDALEERLNGAIHRFMNNKDRTVSNVQEAMKKELDRISEEQLLMGKLAKRNAYLNFVKRQETIAYIKQNFKDNPFKGLSALMTGVQSMARGSRASAALQQQALGKMYTSGLIGDIDAAGLRGMVKDGAFSEQVADYMWVRDKPDELKNKQFPKEVRELGDIFAKWNELARQDANDAGAAIGSMRGYITRQSHEMMKVRNAGFDKWRDDILEHLDRDRLIDDIRIRDGEPEADAIDRHLRNVFEAIESGDYMRADKIPSSVKGVANIGRSMAHDRKLHFKDGKSWYKYNEKYGSGSLQESILWSLYRSAEKTGLMRTFGPNPEDNIQATINLMKDTIKDDPARKEKLINSFKAGGPLRKQYLNISGEANIPYSDSVAKWSAIARGIETMASLGGATISAISDLPLFAIQWQRQYGSYLDGISMGLRDLLTTSPFGQKSDRIEAASMLGIMNDSITGSVASRFSGNFEVPGSMADMVNKFFKLNGLHWWTDTLKQSFVFGLSHQLARRRGGSFADLPQGVRDVASFFNIDESDWDIFKASETFDFRGQELLSSQKIADVPDDVIAKTVQAEIDRIRARGGDNADAQIKAAIRKKRKDTQLKWQSYFLDRAEHAVITPDSKTNSILNQGLRPGTVEGEVARMFMQFKAFPVTILQKGMGAQMFSKGVEFDDMNMRASLGQGIQHEYQGIIGLTLAMTAFGYAALAAKDTLKGKKPRDPLDPKTVLASMTQGGSLGLIGDLMFNPVPSRAGGGLGAFAGPVAGDMGKVYDIYQGLMAGEDKSAAAIRQAISMVPGNNLFYVKPLLDYGFVHSMNEAISPGYLRRTERRLEREQGVEYWSKPSTDRAKFIEETFR